jgi:Uma2 family endonuclease
MIQQQVFDETRHWRMELIHGEVREMSPPGPTQEVLVERLTKSSYRNLDDDLVIIRVQDSIGLPQSRSAPQPDVAWVKVKNYWDERPGAEDVLLVIEVADSSLGYHEGEKAALYAEARIADYWIVNIPHWCVDCYRDPVGGNYQAWCGMI